MLAGTRRGVARREGRRDGGQGDRGRSARRRPTGAPASPRLRRGGAHEPAARQHHPAHRRPAHPGRRAAGPAAPCPGKERLRLFDRALDELPRGVPVNVILFPMEGDPMAAPRFLEAGHGDPRLLHDPVEGLAVRRRERRPFEVFSLSFLDCICCGFGAIILLLVLTKMGEPAALERAQRGPLRRCSPGSRRSSRRSAARRPVLNRDLRGPRAAVSEERAKVARLQGDLSRVQGQFAASKELSAVQDIIAGRLLAGAAGAHRGDEAAAEAAGGAPTAGRPTRRSAASRWTASTSSSSSTPRAACSATPGRRCARRWTRCSTPTRRSRACR